MSSTKASSSRGKGRWTREEHDSFLAGLARYGKDWVSIGELLVPSRTVTQIRTHAQKYFQKADKGLPFPDDPYTSQYEEEGERAEASALPDPVTFSGPSPTAAVGSRAQGGCMMPSGNEEGVPLPAAPVAELAGGHQPPSGATTRSHSRSATKSRSKLPPTSHFPMDSDDGGFQAWSTAAFGGEPDTPPMQVPPAAGFGPLISGGDDIWLEDVLREDDAQRLFLVGDEFGFDFGDEFGSL